MLPFDVALHCEADVVGRRWELTRLTECFGGVSSSASDVDDDCGLEQGGLVSATLPYTRA